MLSSSVVSLSFSILTNFEYKKGIVQIILNSSVIDINHIDVIFFAIKIIKLITSGQERFEKGGFARFHKIIADFPRNMPVAAYFLENAILLLPGGGAFAHFLKPHRGVFVWAAPGPTVGALICSLSKRKWQMPEGEGDGHAWDWLSHKKMLCEITAKVVSIEFLLLRTLSLTDKFINYAPNK